MACLQVNITMIPLQIQLTDVTMIPLQIQLTTGIICDFGERFEPLLVDEGYLFVEENGVISFLTVNKETIR